MDSASTLMWGVIFGSIGLGLFIYGKKRKLIVFFCCGIGLMGIPYFIANVYILVACGLIMAILPFIIKR